MGGRSSPSSGKKSIFVGGGCVNTAKNLPTLPRLSRQPNTRLFPRGGSGFQPPFNPPHPPFQLSNVARDALGGRALDKRPIGRIAGQL
jgi:hypothetical protein